MADGAGTYALMPSVSADWLGVKILSILSAPRAGRPAILGNYLLLDPQDTRVRATIDGTALTAIRTPAVSALAIEHIAAPDAERVTIVGTGTQARAHLRTLVELGRFADFTVVGRDAGKAAALAEEFPGARVRVGELEPAVRDADVIVCCTSSATPLFDGALVRPTSAVVAMGTFQLSARELDDALLGRSTVYVESIETALAEAGEIHSALQSGAITTHDLRTLEQLVAPLERIDYTRPRVFKSCGMAWEDLAVASEIMRQHARATA